MESGIGAVESGETAILRRRVEELEAEKVAQFGSWFLNPVTNEVKWSEELFRILGYDPDEEGKMFRVVGTVLDVTEPRRDRRQATRIARFLQEAQSVAKVGSLVWEIESPFLAENTPFS